MDLHKGLAVSLVVDLSLLVQFRECGLESLVANHFPDRPKDWCCFNDEFLQRVSSLQSSYRLWHNWKSTQKIVKSSLRNKRHGDMSGDGWAFPEVVHLYFSAYYSQRSRREESHRHWLTQSPDNIEQTAFPSRSCSLTRFLRKSAKISNWTDSAWIKAHQSISRHLIRRLGACAALSVSCHNLISPCERRIICDLVKVPHWPVLQPSAALPYPNLPCCETQTTFDRSASWLVAESLVRSHFAPDQDTIVLISRFADQLQHISAVSVWMCSSVMLTWVFWRGQMALEIFHSPHLTHPQSKAIDWRDELSIIW